MARLDDTTESHSSRPMIAPSHSSRPGELGLANPVLEDNFVRSSEAVLGEVTALLDEVTALLENDKSERIEALPEALEIGDMKTMEETLRKAIADSELSYSRLAQESGVVALAIGRFVRGERDLRLESAGKIAAALGLRLSKEPTHELAGLLV